MKKHLLSILLSVLLLAGLGLLLYPTVSDLWNSLHQSRAIKSYVDTVNALNNEEGEKMLKEAREYNDKLYHRGNLIELSEGELEEYRSVLDITGTGIMGYLEIPRIQVSLPIYHSTDESVLQVAIGHVEGTSLPVGGKSTHAVLSGHRGLPSAKLLSDLDQMEAGDQFVIQVLKEKLTYQVDQIRIVLPAEVNDLAASEGKDYVTLVTCTPYGVNTHRLLVRGHRVATEEEHVEVLIAPDAIQIQPVKVAVALAAPILGILLLAVLLHRPGKSQSKGI